MQRRDDRYTGAYEIHGITTLNAHIEERDLGEKVGAKVAPTALEHVGAHVRQTDFDQYIRDLL